MFPSQARQIPALTGLRGVAAIWVVLYHFYPETPVLDRGYLGVDVFFILSGFVLSHVYAGQFRHPSASLYLKFIQARMARIYPLHLFMLAMLALIVLSVPHFTDDYTDTAERFSLGSFVASALLIQNWFHWKPGSWNTPAWSLSAEWAAYIAFPLFVLLTQQWRSVILTLALAAASLAACAAVLATIGTFNLTGVPGMIRMATEFACGCLLYRASALGVRRLPVWTGGLALFLIVLSMIQPWAYFLAIFGLGLIVLLSAQDSFVARALSFRPIHFLGEISYSIYLVHWPVAQLMNWGKEGALLRAIPPPLLNVCTLLLILVLSYATYRTVELRGREWGRRMGIQGAMLRANADAV